MQTTLLDAWAPSREPRIVDMGKILTRNAWAMHQEVGYATPTCGGRWPVIEPMGSRRFQFPGFDAMFFRRGLSSVVKLIDVGTGAFRDVLILDPGTLSERIVGISDTRIEGSRLTAVGDDGRAYNWHMSEWVGNCTEKPPVFSPSEHPRDTLLLALSHGMRGADLRSLLPLQDDWKHIPRPKGSELATAVERIFAETGCIVDDATEDGHEAHDVVLQRMRGPEGLRDDDRFRGGTDRVPLRTNPFLGERRASHDRI